MKPSVRVCCVILGANDWIPQPIFRSVETRLKMSRAEPYNATFGNVGRICVTPASLFFSLGIIASDAPLTARTGLGARELKYDVPATFPRQNLPT
jgi:hypothetical protein